MTTTNVDREISEAIDHAFTDLETNWVGTAGETIGWEDGCLFVYGADYESDEC